MFVNIVNFPPIRAGREAEFLDWFDHSNAVYGGFDGFVSRRLLRSRQEGRYAAIVEHRSESTFMAMHTSAQRQDLWEQVAPLIHGAPEPHFYEVVEEARAA